MVRTHDRRTGERDIEASQVNGPRLKVSRLPTGQPEIFLSIQGEGASLGTQSVFLRLALCNLACIWCDTKYTWDWHNYDYHREAMELTQQQVEESITKYPCHHLVITGGEPLLQKRALEPLVRSLKSKGFSFEIETNGTIPPGAILGKAIGQWNVSPKLANSGNQPGTREVPNALNSFGQLPNAYFKFVISEREDLEEVRTLAQRYGVPKERVLLMPEGTTVKKVQERGRWLVQACVDEGYRFTTRLHILLWGDKRGR